MVKVFVTHPIMASSSLLPKAAKRIQKELVEFKNAPPQYVPKMAVDETNMRNLYFLIEGADDSPFKGGEYVVIVELQQNYPMSAPAIRMLTPSGRFMVDTSICTTFTVFHPESWSPTYNFTNIMLSFVSFMLDTDYLSTHSVGGMQSTDDEIRAYATKSKEYNRAKGYYTLFD